MLKRYQVLLNEWLGDHIKIISEKYDLSFSEVIRVMLCLQFIQLATIAYPKTGFKVPFKEIKELIQKRNANNLDLEKIHRFISYMYFESRKAMEAWNAEEEKRRKKNGAI